MLEEKLLYPANYSIHGLDLFEEKLTSFKINTSFEGKRRGEKKRNERPGEHRATERPCAMGTLCIWCTPPHPSSCGCPPSPVAPSNQDQPGLELDASSEVLPASRITSSMHPHHTPAPPTSQNRSPFPGSLPVASPSWTHSHHGGCCSHRTPCRCQDLSQFGSLFFSCPLAPAIVVTMRRPGRKQKEELCVCREQMALGSIADLV